MNARAYQPPDRDIVQVWLWEETPRGRRAYISEGQDRWRLDDVQQGGVMPVAFEMPPSAFRAIVAAGSDFAPPSEAQAAHLNDAIQVRDRLLALVEKGKR